MTTLIRSLGFFSAIINGLFVTTGVVTLLLRSSVQSLPQGRGGLPAGAIQTITSIMTYAGLAIVVIFSLGFVFAVLVLVNSFRKPARSKAVTSTAATQPHTD